MKQSEIKTIKVRGELLSLSAPLVMGILNVTPDSFYSESRVSEESLIIERIQQLVIEGADIIDIGGYSSRPFAEDISIEEECQRLCKGLALIRKEVPNAIVSVDTFRAEVVKRCAGEYGIDIVNDISGGSLDSEMYRTVAHLNLPYVLMHMRGNPHTMTTLTDYNHVTVEVIRDLGCKINQLRELGVNDIIIDPGFGFSKTVNQNFQLLNELEEFHYLELPLLVGVSRKSMIYKTLNTTPQEALNGTTVLNTLAVAKGAHILRVHDVKEAVEVVKLVTATNTCNHQ